MHHFNIFYVCRILLYLSLLCSFYICSNLFLIARFFKQRYKVSIEKQHLNVQVGLYYNSNQTCQANLFAHLERLEINQVISKIGKVTEITTSVLCCRHVRLILNQLGEESDKTKLHLHFNFQHKIMCKGYLILINFEFYMKRGYARYVSKERSLLLFPFY